LWEAITEPHRGHFLFLSLVVEPEISYSSLRMRSFFCFGFAAAGAGDFGCAGACDISSTHQALRHI
jgi:hypothetical protein